MNWLSYRNYGVFWGAVNPSMGHASSLCFTGSRTRLLDFYCMRIDRTSARTQ